MAKHGSETDRERLAGVKAPANDNKDLMRRMELLENEITGLEIRIERLRAALLNIGSRAARHALATDDDL